MKKTAAAVLLGLFAATTIRALSENDHWETIMLPPGQTPEGSGWKPMRAVEHTSLYGGLAGKPQARVVWKRRRRPVADEPKRKRPSLFTSI